VPLSVQTSLASGVEATKRIEAATMLARWIGTRRELRLVALPHLSRLALALDKPFPEEVLQPVRALLEQGEGETLPGAIVCAGRLCDYAAIPHLVRWLRDGDAGVKSDALWSLRQISGLVFDDDASRWQSWYASESAWWDNDSRAAFESLRSGTRIEKVDALRAIAGMHAWREKLAEHVAVLLDDADTELAGYAARLLGRLGSRASIAPLLDALAIPSCAEAAHSALEALAHKKLPLDLAGCRDALGAAP
jgi:HEAT repeat protein